MTSSSTIHVSAGYSWSAILLDKLRLSLRFRLRLPEIDDVRNPLIAHAAIGSAKKNRRGRTPEGIRPRRFTR